MSSLPMISIIIVNYNGGELLSQCVRSALDSSIPVEVLVADNRSSDSSISVLEKTLGHDERLKIYKNKANLGFAKANNQLIAKAAGDFLLILNPDSLIRPDTLEKMIRVMEQDAKIGMAGCLICNSDGSEQAGSRRYVPTPWRSFVSLFRLSGLFHRHQRFRHVAMAGQPLPAQPTAVEAISGAFMLVRRTALEQVGPMDEAYFIHCEDLDWCMRFRQKGWKIVFVPKVETMHVKGVCTASRPFRVEFHKHKGMIHFYNKFFRHQYPGLLMWVVVAGVWLRFSLRIIKITFQGLIGKILPPAASSFEAYCNPPATETDLPEEIDGKKSVVVTGASSQIGVFLLPLLADKGYQVCAVSRNPEKQRQYSSPLIRWQKADINFGLEDDSLKVDVLIHLAPLKHLPPLLASLRKIGLRRIVAFSSTSIFSKKHSQNANEQQFVKDLLGSEKSLAEQCKELDIAWTILRPTLIYGCGMDKNITNIAQFIKKFGFFPLVGNGRGLRQPVHAQDLAEASVTALESPSSHNKSYNLSGGKTVSYKEMVEDIFKALGKKPRILEIPLPIMKGFLKFISFLPGYDYITPEMASRINDDLCFEHGEATNDLAFHPRPFTKEQIPVTEP